MAKVNTKKSKSLIESIGRKLDSRRRKGAAILSGVFVDEALKKTPVEGGHVHEAWLSALDEAAPKFGPFQRQAEARVASHQGDASNDPKAKKAGNGRVKDIAHVTKVTLKNTLDFLFAQEEGGIIQPIDPGGPKRDKTIRFPPGGPLYGKRTGSVGGVVAWMEGGIAKFATHRTLKATHAITGAIQATKSKAKSLGMKVK